MPGEIQPSCPICGTGDLKRGVACRNMTVFECRSCTHAFLGPPKDQATGSADLYGHTYRGYQPDSVLAQRLDEEIRMVLLPRLNRGARILDMGCGSGTFLERAEAAGFAPEGVDVSAAAVTLCRDRGLCARQGDVRKLEWRDRFDCVTLWDVLEHLPDPLRVCRSLNELLNPGGFILIKVPWVRPTALFLAQRLPSVFRVLSHAPAHVQFFSSRSLAHLFRVSGFGDVEWLRSRPMHERPRLLVPSLRRAASHAAQRAWHSTGVTGNFMVLAHRSSDVRHLW